VESGSGEGPFDSTLPASSGSDIVEAPILGATLMNEGTEEGDIDSGLLASLSRTLDADTVLALLDDLRTEADAMPTALEAAQAATDTVRADRVLHSLKGAAATLGLAGMARRIEGLRTEAVPRRRSEEVQRALLTAIDKAKELVRRIAQSDAA
jgi:HPt (histidine-containing phosphotransfer) domain-containing protein